jgi:hypothetical protein
MTTNRPQEPTATTPQLATCEQIEQIAIFLDQSRHDPHFAARVQAKMPTYSPAERAMAQWIVAVVTCLQNSEPAERWPVWPPCGVLHRASVH